MQLHKITKLIQKEGIVGLQKLEAWGKIKGEFPQRIGNLLKRGREGKIAFAIARGIGRHSDFEKVLEMIEWLRDGEYLIDYGYLIVSLLRSVKFEHPKSLEESKYWGIVRYFQSQLDGEDDIFNVDFLLDYKRKFRPDVVEWLEKIQLNTINLENHILVKTSVGYSYSFTEHFPDVPEGEVPYMELCDKPGMHYNRYGCHICSD